MLGSPRGAIVLAAVCFGTTGTAQALGPGGTTPLTVGAARIVVGAVLLALVARRRVGRGRPLRLARLPLLGMGLAIAAYQVTFFAAVDRTGVAVGTVVALGSAPAVAGLLGRFVGQEPLSGRWAACTVLAAAGVALLVLDGGTAGIDPLGVLLALGAGAGYATYTVAAKSLLDAGHRPDRVMALGFGAAAVLLAPVLLTPDARWLPTPGGMALALFLGAIPTALGYVLFARGLQVVGSGEAATLTLAEPLTAAALGVVVLGERPGVTAAVGVALVLGGLGALALGPRRGRAPAEPVVSAMLAG